MLSSIIKLVSKGDISIDNAKKILYKAIDQKVDPLTLIKDNNIKQINDDDTLLKIINEIINDNQQQVKDYLEGKEYLVNFFIGKLMQKSNRQANPNRSKELIKECLEKRRK